MIVILIGPPGAGKGTQAQKLASHYGLKHISTGDMLRSALAEGTSLGLKAGDYMKAGKLVPDEIIIGVVLEYINAHKYLGLLLDGFPRTVLQAEGLSKMIKADDLKVVCLDLNDDEVIQRISARRVCRVCGWIYTATDLNAEGTCECGGDLYQREDDKAETIRHRLEVYHQQTKPVLDFYTLHGGVITVPGSGSPDDVFLRLKAALD
jgi:adenylate kinase